MIIYLCMNWLIIKKLLNHTLIWIISTSRTSCVTHTKTDCNWGDQTMVKITKTFVQSKCTSYPNLRIPSSVVTVFHDLIAERTCDILLHILGFFFFSITHILVIIYVPIACSYAGSKLGRNIVLQLVWSTCSLVHSNWECCTERCTGHCAGWNER